MLVLGPDKTFQARYQILGDLGAGGVGAVYHAKQLDMNRDVALKLLKSECGEKPETWARFCREFKLLSRLSHVHIMTVYGLAIDDLARPFAVCEYLNGLNLRELLSQEGSLAWERTVRISIQIASALKYAHEHGILHRDLKPENIMLLDTPNQDFVKLVDFGLSKAFMSSEPESQKLTASGAFVGTAPYVSPEQIYHNEDQRSEVYALGCIIFEMLSGEFLFVGENLIDTLYKHVNECPSERIRSIRSKIPQKLLSLLSSMLAKDPMERPQSMEAVKDLLESILDCPGKMTADGIGAVGLKKYTWQKLAMFGSGLAIFCIIVLTATSHLAKQASSASALASMSVSEDFTSVATKRRKRLDALRTLADECNLCAWNKSEVALNKSQELCHAAAPMLEDTKNAGEKRELQSLMLRGLLCLAREQHWFGQAKQARQSLAAAKLLFSTSMSPAIQENFYITAAAVHLCSALENHDSAELESDLKQLLYLTDKYEDSPILRAKTYIMAARTYKGIGRLQQAQQCINSAIIAAKLVESRGVLDEALALKLPGRENAESNHSNRK